MIGPMADLPQSILQRSLLKAQEQVLQSVRTRYFPEVWYALENWFQLLKGRRALEVGYGIGLVGEAMAKSGWQVTVVDGSTAALAELKERFAHGKLNGTFEQADPDQLPFAAATYDAVAAVNTLEFAVSPPEVAREIARVLAPGGRAVIATFNRMSPWGLPAVASAIRKDRGLLRARFMTKDELVKILGAAGLVVEDVKERAAYLPAGAVKLKLPVPGAFVALTTKAVDGKAKDGDTKGKPAKNFLFET
jgi:2-polyprenyl-3-methyl-5-hydroxy-6-metoxy-1,4-benzoquinol methylase